MSDFSRDAEFCKLLAHRQDVDLATAALELARDEEPELDFQPALQWLEHRAEEVAARASWARRDEDVLAALTHCLAGEHGLRGDPDSYLHADGSYLHRVIATGAGLPIALSVLYISVAARAGVALEGVSAPMHFLSRYEAARGRVYLDAFSGGRLMSEPECMAWLQSLTGLERAQVRSTLRPAAPRTVILRMLSHLKAIHARLETWESLWRVQRRLVALRPSSYAERRDLAVLAVRTGRYSRGIDLLREIGPRVPESEQPQLGALLSQARRALAIWN